MHAWDRLQTERQLMDRELERRQRRLQFEIQGADSLERARFRDQHESDELASHRANSIRN